MASKSSSRLSGFLRFLVVFLLMYPFGLLCHEVVGHGLPGLIFGGKPQSLHMLGMDLYPRVQWRGWQGTYGYVEGTGVPGDWRMQVVRLGGSLSTSLAAAIALFFLYRRRRRGWSGLILLSISLWWLDLLTYTLPSWGLRRSILWGRVYSEPCEAAVALGMPKWFFQGIVIAIAIFFSVALYRILRRRPQ